MAQPVKGPLDPKNSLNITSFWDGPTVQLPMEWNKWSISLKLPLFAKIGEWLIKSLMSKPIEMTLPPTSIEEPSVDDEMVTNTRDRFIRNTQPRTRGRKSWLAFFKLAGIF